MSKQDTSYALTPIGFVHSSLRERSTCPKHAWLGAPEAWLQIEPAYLEALEGLEAGQEVIVLTWLHHSDRSVLKVHPGRDPSNPLCGVFHTRSPDRPNPVGLHRLRILEMPAPGRLRVSPLEVVDGTPVIDIKPVLTRTADA